MDRRRPAPTDGPPPSTRSPIRPADDRPLTVTTAAAAVMIRP